MPLDPSIILGFKQPQIDSPDEMQLKRANLQNVLQTNDINGLKLSEARNSIDRENNLRTLLSNTPEDQRVDTLTRAGYLDQADKLSKANIERQNALTQQQTAKLTQAKAKNELIGQHMGFLKDNPTDENLKSTLNSLVQQGVMSAEEAQNAYANGPKDPEGIRVLATQHFQSSVSTEKQLGQIIQQKLGGKNQVNQVNPVTGTVKTLSDTPVTVSPDTVANNDVKVSEGKLNRQNAINVAGVKTAAETSNVEGISPEAISAAAERYRIDGTLPALGMGKSAGAVRTQILNKAAELDTKDGINGQDARTNQIGGKATTAGITQLEKQKNMVSAFEKNANKNADMALSLSDQVDRTGVPVLNSWIQAGQKNVTGNPKVSQFHAANETFVNEYAKIMSGSMGNTAVSDSARAHAHSLLSTAQSKEQYKAIVQTLKQEMDNRMAGLDEELASAKTSLHTKPNKTSTAKPGTAEHFIENN